MSIQFITVCLVTHLYNCVLPVVSPGPPHGLPALRQVPGNKWLGVAMIRMNHKGKSMDAEDYATPGLGNVSEVVTHVKQVRQDGMGVISMKLAGEGTFTTFT